MGKHRGHRGHRGHRRSHKALPATQEPQQPIHSILRNVIDTGLRGTATAMDAVKAHPLLTVVGIATLTAMVVEAVNTYSVGAFPSEGSANCQDINIPANVLGVPQCKTYGLYEGLNTTIQNLVGQLYDQLQGTRFTECLVSNCRPDAAMSKIYGECIESNMDNVLRAVLNGASRLNQSLFDPSVGAPLCITSMPDWRIAQHKNWQTHTSVLVSLVDVIVTHVLPDICVRFQQEMLAKTNDCQDATALALLKVKVAAVIAGAVIGSIVGAVLIGAGAYYTWHSRFRSVLQACAAPFVACYQWCMGGSGRAEASGDLVLAPVTYRVEAEPQASEAIANRPLHFAYGATIISEDPSPAVLVASNDQNLIERQAANASMA